MVRVSTAPQWLPNTRSSSGEIRTIAEVPEGQWAQLGSIRRLPEIAAAAQFGHLETIARRAS